MPPPTFGGLQLLHNKSIIPIRFVFVPSLMLSTLQQLAVMVNSWLLISTRRGVRPRGT